MNTNKKKHLSIFCCKSWSATWQDVEMLLREVSAILNEYCFIKFISDIDVHTAQALVSFKKYMPPPIPYFKVNICPFPLPHFTSIFLAYLWSFRWPNCIVTLPRYFPFQLPHLNIPPQTNWTRINSERSLFYF